MIGERTLCSESDKTRSRAARRREVPRDIPIISLSSSGVIFGRDESSAGETPKPFERLVTVPSPVAKSSPTLH